MGLTMKILVISLAGIGDTLFATPLIHELRLHYPEATLDAFVLWGGAKSVLEGNPHLNAVFQKNLINSGKLDSLKFIWQLRRQRYDISINTHPQSRIHYRFVARLINATVRMSHAYDNSNWLDQWLINRRLPQDYARHCIDNNLALLQLLRRQPLLPQHDYEIYPTSAESAWAENFMREQHLAGRTIMGLHVGSGGTKNLALRRWPVASYIELIRKLKQAHPELAILLFGGSEEEPQNRAISTATGTAVILPKTPGLREAAALIGKCDFFLSVDTALMHIAAAMQVPKQFVIETPTWNRPIEPYRNPFTLIQNPAVAGRNLEYYRYNGHGIRGTARELTDSMASVTVESVFQAITAQFPKRAVTG